MNNTEKLLRAFIEASGYEVESFTREAQTGEEPDAFLLDKNYCVDYKVTKKPITEERRKFLTDNNMLLTLAVEEDK